MKLPDCPATHENCSSGHEYLDIGRGPTLLSISSSCVSCFGSLLILLTYLMLKDMRTGAQKIITLLALADFITAAGFIFGGVNYLLNREECKLFSTLCVIQSTVTTWSSMCSFWWTSILAFYFFLVLVMQRHALASRLLIINNVLAWISPMVIVLPLLVKDKLGYAPYATSNWCFIKDTRFMKKTLDDSQNVVIFVLLGGKLWEIITYGWISVLYIVILCKVSGRVRKMNTLATAGRVERRLLAIPAFFILCRIWGTLQFFFSLKVPIHSGCVSTVIFQIYIFFGYIQALGDGGQGWCNAILYILLSPSIRRKVIVNPCNRFFTKLTEKAAELLESSVSRTHHLSERTSIMANTANEKLENNADPGVADVNVKKSTNTSESSYHSVSSGRGAGPGDIYWINNKQCM